MNTKRIKIKVQKQQSKWDLSLILKAAGITNIEKYEQRVEKETEKFIAKWSKNEAWLKDDKILKQALIDFEIWAENFGTYDALDYYNYLAVELDEANPTLRSKCNKLHKKAIELHNKTQFFTLRLSKLDPKIQKKFLASKELKNYKHFLEILFTEGKYRLSEDEEKIMNLKSKVSHSNWSQMLSSILSKQEREVLNEDGKKEVQNFSKIISLINEQNKKIRDVAAKELNSIFKEHLDIAENEFNSILENKMNDDKIRGFEHPEQSRHISDDISSDVVESLIKAVSKNFKISKDYYKLKAKLFGVKKLAYHERNVEYGKAIDKKISFEESYDLVHKTFTKLDQKFSKEFEQFYSNGQVDVFPKKGKHSGAFCSYGSRILPVYILLNFTGSITDVTTMAHEFGHAFNFELTREKQNTLNFGFPMCTAETASTFFEDFVTDELLKEADDKTRLSLLMSKINNDVSTIFRQIAFYNFEKEIHSEFRKEGYLSNQQIGKIFQKHMKTYMGDYVEQSEGSENWWIYVSHFRSFFYVYSYAFGLLVSKYFQNEVKEDKTKIEDFKTFLAAGSSVAPEKLLLDLGLNIRDPKFWDEAIQSVENQLKEAERLSKKLGLINSI